jgi:hypothetical protein
VILPSTEASYSTAAEGPWQAAVRAEIARQHASPRKDRRFGIRIAFRTRIPANKNEVWDIDNLVKPTLDAMEVRTNDLDGRRTVELLGDGHRGHGMWLIADLRTRLIRRSASVGSSGAGGCWPSRWNDLGAAAFGFHPRECHPWLNRGGVSKAGIDSPGLDEHGFPPARGVLVLPAKALTPGDQGSGMAGRSRDNALDHAVVVVFENRSLDNVLGRLYGPGDGKTFEGVIGKDLTNPIPEWAEHGAERKVVPYAVAIDMDSPNPDTGEEYPHTNTQLFNILSEQNRFKLGAEISAPYNAPADGQAPTMDGFVTDYISTLAAELGRQPTYEEYRR